ncbi:MAG: histidine phosphatase family protein [Candidatus Dormibacteria bacterium]
METRTTIWLVRHGESTWNAAHRVQGQSDEAGPLTERGEQQAQAVAEDLARRAPDARVIVSSDLMRALQTAAILARRLNLEIERDPELREQALGGLEGRESGNDEVVAEFERLWQEPWPSLTGGESVAELYTRVHDALVAIAARWPDDELIAVTHGGPQRAAIAACGVGLADMKRSAIPNAALMAVQVTRSAASPPRFIALDSASDV